jgi:hypothetical protein
MKPHRSTTAFKKTEVYADRLATLSSNTYGMFIMRYGETVRVRALHTTGKHKEDGTGMVDGVDLVGRMAEAIMMRAQLEYPAAFELKTKWPKKRERYTDEQLQPLFDMAAQYMVLMEEGDEEWWSKRKSGSHKPQPKK